MRKTTILVITASLANAWPQYLPLNPNALAIPWTIAIGHIYDNGGGPLNQYGWDFSRNGHKWDLCLACADSDGDGWPNGWELGDPCGNWYVHGPPARWNNDISHPGNASSVPETRELDWKDVCGCNPCEQFDASPCTHHIPSQVPKPSHPLSGSANDNNSNNNNNMKTVVSNNKKKGNEEVGQLLRIRGAKHQILPAPPSSFVADSQNTDLDTTRVTIREQHRIAQEQIQQDSKYRNEKKEEEESHSTDGKKNGHHPRNANCRPQAR